MTSPPPQPISNLVQRVAADISARLAQAAKDPPELSAYLQVHAECVVQALQPVGLAYEMATGQNFQRTFTHNYDSLKLRDAPAQDLSFQRAIRSVAETTKPVFLDANMAPADGLHGLKPDDAPAPETLPLHNLTPYQQIFVPIPLNRKVVGVLHAWFSPADATMANARLAILAHACAEVELYLKSRRISDISQELSRISTYARFLEDVAGDQDLESVAWKLVNYAREAVGCDRVCMLVDSRYGLTSSSALPASDRLALQACSGLRRPHARSEHADVLKGHASELLKLAVVKPTEPAADPGRSNSSSADPAAREGKPAGEPAKAAATNGSTPEGRPQMRIIFTTRDPSKVATRPEAVNRYFEVIDMNWSTVLPLYDRDNRVCGTLLFEGQQSHEKMAALFMQMRDLAVSGGRALSTSLVWHRRRTLRGARVLMRWRDQLMGSSRQRLAIKYGLPALLAIFVMVYPFPYRVRGEAVLRPVNVHTVSALTEGRLMEVNAREGDSVKKGQVICVLETANLRLQLQQVEQERQRAETEASRALGQDRSEVNMQIARLSARRAEILAEKLRRDIEFAVIKAPFDGVMIGPLDLAQRKGQIIRIGDTLAEIVDPARWEVNVSVREEDVPKLIEVVNERRSQDPKSGVPGELILAANPNDIYPLTLTDPTSFSHRLDITGGHYNFSAIVPLPEGASRNVGVGPGNELKNGYTGRVKFLCGRRPGADILFGDFVRFVKLHFF